MGRGHVRLRAPENTVVVVSVGEVVVVAAMVDIY